MTNIRQLLAFNLKENRRKLGLSQAKLAEKADLSTQYLAMIELSQKFPSPENLEKLAIALEIDTPELFSMPPSAKGMAYKLQHAILSDLEKAIDVKVHTALKEAISDVVSLHIKNIEMNEMNVE